MNKQNKTPLRIYSNIIEDLSKLKGSNLLPDERIDELVDLTDPKHLVPIELKNGMVIKNEDWVFHPPTSRVFFQSKNSDYFTRNSILEELLIEEEIIQLNQYANAVYSEKRNQERFEKGKKIHWKNYNGRICYSDDYYKNLYEFAERILENEDDVIQAFEDRNWEEFIAAVPNYVESVEDHIYFPKLNTTDLEERFCEEAIDWNGGPNFNGEKELDEALAKFYEINKDVTYYTTDGGFVILDEEFWKGVYKDAIDSEKSWIVFKLRDIMDKPDALEWLEEPNKAFEGQSPNQLIENGQIVRVEQAVDLVELGEPI